MQLPDVEKSILVSHKEDLTTFDISKYPHTKMKSGLRMGSPCAAHGLPAGTVGSSVDRSCPLFMLIHYTICPCAAHGHLSGNNVDKTLYTIRN